MTSAKNQELATLSNDLLVIAEKDDVDRKREIRGALIRLQALTGWDEREIARQLKISHQTVYRWANGQNPPQRASLFALYRTLLTMSGDEEKREVKSDLRFMLIKEIIEEAGERRIKRLIIEFE